MTHNVPNTINFDFDSEHNIFETLTPYYPHITNISYNTYNKIIPDSDFDNTNPNITITFTNQTILEKFITEHQPQF